MKASPSSGTLRKMLDRLLALIMPPAPRPAPTKPTPPAPSFASPQALSAATPGLAKTMRSFEEVRADLARLRATSKQRHARVPIKRQTTFDAAVFAAFVNPEPKRIEIPEAAYPQTVYVGCASSKPASPDRLRSAGAPDAS